jgi:hypothetical protein
MSFSAIVNYVSVLTILTLYCSTSLLGTMTTYTDAAGEPIKLGVKVLAPDFFSYLAQEKGFFEQNTTQRN